MFNMERDENGYSKTLDLGSISNQKFKNPPTTYIKKNTG